MKKLLILSGKGGTGKTSTAAAFIRFASAKAVADCDVDAPNLHLIHTQKSEPERICFMGSNKAQIDPEKCIGCGLCAEKCRFDAVNLKDGKYVIDEYCCEGCGVCTLVCTSEAISLEADAAGMQEVYTGDGIFSTARLKMGRGNSGKLVTAVKNAMLKAADAELAIIDGSPGIGCPVIASISGADLVLIVAEPSLSGISDLERLVKTAGAFQSKLAVCVNKYDVSPECTEAIEAFCIEQGISFAGKVPYDKTASDAINSGRSLADIDCPAGQALREVFNKAMSLLGL